MRRRPFYSTNFLYADKQQIGSFGAKQIVLSKLLPNTLKNGLGMKRDVEHFKKL